MQVIYNGVDEALWPFGAAPRRHAVWSGRISPNKGAHLAILAARRAGLALTLYGSIEDQDYWRREVQPRLGGTILYGGLVEQAELALALRDACVYLFTPCWDEPFGLAAVEAMFCGTPVAAFDCGAVREVIGSAVAFAPPGSIEGLAAALEQASRLDRSGVRDRARRLFSLDAMIDAFLDVYSEMAALARPVDKVRAASVGL